MESFAKRRSISLNVELKISQANAVVVRVTSFSLKIPTSQGTR